MKTRPKKFQNFTICLHFFSFSLLVLFEYEGSMSNREHSIISLDICKMLSNDYRRKVADWFYWWKIFVSPSNENGTWSRQPCCTIHLIYTISCNRIFWIIFGSRSHRYCWCTTIYLQNNLAPWHCPPPPKRAEEEGYRTRKANLHACRNCPIPTPKYCLPLFFVAIAAPVGPLPTLTTLPIALFPTWPINNPIAA